MELRKDRGASCVERCDVNTMGLRLRLSGGLQVCDPYQNPAARTEGSGQKIPFEVVTNKGKDGKLILTDQAEAVLEYAYQSLTLRCLGDHSCKLLLLG